MAGNLQGQALRRVGVVGLGHMGHTLAVNLIEDGHQVFVYDQDPKRAAALTDARAAAQLADLGDCDVVLTSLPNDDALVAVALGPGGLAGVLGPGAVHISTSTVSPAVSCRVAEEHARTTRIMSPRRCSGTPISRGNGSSSCWSPDLARRWKRSAR